DADQIAAVVDALDAHSRRQDAGGVDAPHLRLDRADGRHALRSPAHQHDPLDDIVIGVLAGDAEPRLMAHLDRGDVGYQHRGTVAETYHGVAQILERANQADAAHHRRLRSDVEGLTADVEIGVTDRLQYLRQRQLVGGEEALVHSNRIRAGHAAPAGDIDYARHGLEAPLEHPVLQRLRVHHRIARGAQDAIAEHFADRAPR